MEARGRRFSGGFPGYEGPALPRAMRSSRGRGEAARRQSAVVARTGFFELLATVAGRILQDTGINSGQCNKANNVNEQESLKENLPSEIDSQVSSVGSVTNHGVLDKRQSASVAFHLVAPSQLGMNEEEVQLRVAGEGKTEVVAGQTQNCFQSSEAAVWSPSQEEQSNVVVKEVTPVDEDSAAAPVNITSSPPADQEYLPPPCDSDLSTAKFDPSPGSPSIEIKEITSISELQGVCTEMKQFPDDEMQGHFEMIEMMVSEQIMEGEKQATLGFAAGDITSSSMEFKQLPTMVQEKPTTETNVISVEKGGKESRGYLEAMGEVMVQVLEAPIAVMTEADSLIPEFQMHCQSSESGDVMKLTSPMDLGEDKDDENASMEDKGIVVDEKIPPSVATSGCSKVAPPAGLAEGQGMTRPVLKRVICKKDGKMSRMEKVCSSQCLVPETNLKDPYRKGLESQKNAEVVKCIRTVETRRRKRHHTDMESMDSGSSEEAGFEKERLSSGGRIAPGLTRQQRTRGSSSKRKNNVVDGSCNSTELHLNTVDLMEMGYEYVDGEPPAAAAKLRSAKAASVASSPTGKGSSKLTSKKSLEPHVKLSIKSFTVPELFVDLPESASILNLKRAVMEAAMNLLGGGLRVRVLLQGKKVPDEGATLLQMGISRSAKPESLGFMLEPSPVPTSTSATAAEDPLLVLSHANNPPLPRYPVFGVQGLSGSVERGGRCCGKGRSTRASGMVVDADPTTFVAAPPMPADHQQGYIDGKQTSGLKFPMTPDETLKGCNGMKTKLTHLNERMAVSPHSTRVAAAGALAAIRAQADANRRAKNELDPPSTVTTNMSQDSLEGESGAIILHPGVGTGENMPGMALVPVRQKTGALDVGKRRMRCPFSVAEVEALVHAVEKLGTGRWRDVKLRAFDHAKHRTYVDLKDKWKTLVHTARIAPHQRRGEPVPQELLERVTRAHSYWSAQAAKQQAELDF